MRAAVAAYTAVSDGDADDAAKAADPSDSDNPAAAEAAEEAEAATEEAAAECCSLPGNGKRAAAQR